MNLTQAITTARRRVAIVPNGRHQYVLHTWSPQHNATWVSHSMDWWHAVSAAKEAKIRTALDLLGVEEAGAEANIISDTYSGRWDALVRDFFKKRNTKIT